jgi:gamma-glutamyl-gamma-aminobutyrate hydrolase PuuD
MIVEKPLHLWVSAVQWQPEITAATDPEQQRLVDELVNVARQKMQSKVADKEE